jgi:uncharacterized RDD family membrane protein YckC
MATPTGSASQRPRSRADARIARARSLQGVRAGFVSRLAADTIDVIAVVAIEFGMLLLATVIRYLFTRHFKLLDLPTWLTLGIFWVIAVAYLTSGWATTGKTLGKQVAGVRVVGANGSRLRSGSAFARAVLYAVFPAGLVWSLFSRKNASLQDLLLRTVVVYDWAYRGLEATVQG